MDEVVKYTEELERLKILAVNQFGELTEIEKETIDKTFEWLIENIKIEEGQFTIPKNLLEEMNRFVLAVVDIVATNEQYTGKVVSYLKNIDLLGENTLSFHKQYNGLTLKAKKEGAQLSEVQKIITDSLLDSYLDNGLNVHFAEPLKDLIYRNILSGMSLKEAKFYLGEYILSGKNGVQTNTNEKGAPGKLSRYLNQTATIGVDTYTGMINMQIYKAYEKDITGFIMSGSLIETSSTQCRKGVTEARETGGYLTKKQIEDLFTIAKNNKAALLIEGTDFSNLDINKFHWGCRHEFTPIIKKPN